MGASAKSRTVRRSIAPPRRRTSCCSHGRWIVVSQTGTVVRIAAAQGAASGALNEVDLEHRAGRLVYNVDVGAKDVKVDASSGQVVAVDGDD